MSSLAASPTVPSALRLLRLRGDDAARFLHGQLTCDVTGLPGDRWTWAGYCSAKGRLQAVGRLARVNEVWFLELPASELDPIASLLRKFVLRAKVVIEPAFGAEAAVLVTGPGVGAGLAPRTGRSLDPGVAAEIDGVVIWMIDGSSAILHGEVSAVSALVHSVQAVSGDIEVKDARPEDDVAAGYPWLSPATRDAFVPQMVDLERLGGVSFDKGCYPGQEIVARSQYLGRVKRRLHLARADVPDTPSPGDPVLVAADGQPAGTVLRARSINGDGCLLLAVLDHELAGGRPLRLSAGAPLFDVRPCRPD